MRSMQFLLVWLLVLAAVDVSAQQQQQQQQGNQPPVPQGPMIVTVDATVKEVEIKGRARKLTVTSSTGEDLVIPLTPKIRFEVRADGDEGFIRPGQMFEAEGVMTNKRLFVSDVTIYLLPKGKKPTPGRMAKAPAEPGESTETYQISGPIIAKQADTDFPEYMAVALRTSGPSVPVMLEKNYSLVIVSDDLSQVTVGMPVEVEGLPGPNGRFTVGRVTVILPDTLKADEVLGPLEEAKKN